MDDDVRRLFFGLELEAAWFEPPPSGRILEPKNRHLTLAFLGNISLSKLQGELTEYTCTERLGPLGICNKMIFLPKRRPNVAAGQIVWLDEGPFDEMRGVLVEWLRDHDYPVDERPFLSHVTMARGPFVISKWKKAFSPFPILAKGLHLFESLGHSEYNSVWEKKFILPFEEIEHTADVGYRIYGGSYKELFRHAEMALAFAFPPMTPFLSLGEGVDSLDEVIIELNQRVSRIDMEIGAPFKAVSFHGEAVRDEKGFLVWEMIVDV
jgi:RNA 2',3'-cyclic 3'-phosphodiesterase